MFPLIDAFVSCSFTFQDATSLPSNVCFRSTVPPILSHYLYPFFSQRKFTLNTQYQWETIKWPLAWLEMIVLVMTVLPNTNNRLHLELLKARRKLGTYHYTVSRSRHRDEPVALRFGAASHLYMVPSAFSNNSQNWIASSSLPGPGRDRSWSWRGYQKTLPTLSSTISTPANSRRLQWRKRNARKRRIYAVLREDTRVWQVFASNCGVAIPPARSQVTEKEVGDAAIEGPFEEPCEEWAAKR